ncbi:MAG: NDP-sugar synthase, partial [Candidatus Nanohaloarchaea archaeon]
GIATMALTTATDTADYGVVRMKGDRIVGFTEKPDTATSHLINAGIYLVDPAVIDRVPPREETTQVDIETIFEDLAGDGQLNGYVFEGEWREVG